MLTGLYSAGTALEASTRNQEIVAENLANVATPGYRRQGVIFEVAGTSLIPGANPGSAGSAGQGAAPTSFTRVEAGPLERTNNPLDVAVTGNAFFVVEGPNGPLYTRNGSFTLDSTGALRTRGGGYRVAGVSQVPANSTDIVVARDGTVTANGANMGRLQLASFTQPDALRRVGSTLFEGDAAQTPAAGAVQVEQGFREGSNVQPAQEMISMMMGLHFYEAAEKALRAMSDAVAQNTRPQA